MTKKIIAYSETIAQNVFIVTQIKLYYYHIAAIRSTLHIRWNSVYTWRNNEPPLNVLSAVKGYHVETT